MAVKIIEERKKQKYLILIFLAVILITVVVVWFGFFKKERIFPVATITPLKEINIDFEVLKNPFLKEIQPFVKIFPFEGLIGRENPFLKY